MEDKSAIANIVRRGLKKHKFGRLRLKEEVETSSQIEVIRLEEKMQTLSTISGVAPLIGFLGTILSVGSLFKMLQNQQSNATFGDFSHAIWNALISSGLGIFVGIIALTIYNYLLSKISKVVLDMERIASEIFDLIEYTENETVSEGSTELKTRE
jgi:biopolymer transport protein ExbB